MNKRLLKKLMEKRKELCISDGAFILLLYLYAHGGDVTASLADLAKEMGVTVRSICYQMDSLVENGLVEKLPNTHKSGHLKNRYKCVDIGR